MDFTSLLSGLGGGGGGSGKVQSSASSSTSIGDNIAGLDVTGLLPWVIGGFAAVIGLLLLVLVIKK